MKNILRFWAFVCLFLAEQAFGQKIVLLEPMIPIPSVNQSTEKWMEWSFKKKSAPKKWVHKTPKFEALRSFEESPVISFLDSTAELRRIKFNQFEVNYRWGSREQFFSPLRRAVVFDFKQ
jgi:hypothetical protein